jgi:hypothetical protein
MLCGLVVGVAIGTLIGAIILRAACWLYNKLAGGPGSPSAVPEPTMGSALGIAFVTMLVQFGVGMVLGLLGAAAQSSPLVINLISMPISFLVSAWMISLLLPTTFPRALLVALLEFVIGIIIAVVLVMIFALVFGVMLAGGAR